MGRFWGLALCLVLAAPGATAWSMLQGDAARSGSMDAAAEPLDVERIFQMHDPTYTTESVWGISYFPTPYGVAALLRHHSTGGCAVWMVTDLAGPYEPPRTVDGCYLGQAFAFVDRGERGAILACSAGDSTSTSVMMIDVATAASVWVKTGRELGFTPLDRPDEVPGSLPDVNDVTDPDPRPLYVCLQGAVSGERGLAIVPYAMTSYGIDSNNTIVALNLTTGDVVWAQPVDPAASVVAGIRGVRPPEAVSGRGFYGLSVTLTETGIVVAGIVVPCVNGICNEEDSTDVAGAVAWLDYGGQVVGFETVEFGSSEADDGASFATSNGGQAYHRIGRRLVRVDTRDATIKGAADLAVGGSIGDRLVSWGPAMLGDRVIVPVDDGLIALDGGTDLAGQWDGPGYGWLLGTLSTRAGGDVLALSLHFLDVEAEMPASDETRLTRLDASLHPLQVLPLPVRHFRDNEPDVFLPVGVPEEVVQPNTGSSRSLVNWYNLPETVPLAHGRILIVDREGVAALLGPTNPSSAPDLAMSPAAPPTGQESTLDIGAMPGATQLVVLWGGDEPELRMAWDGRATSIAHHFLQPGAVQLTVTAVFSDGRTHTGFLDVDVGAKEKEPLTFLQDAFSADKQNTTFFLIGLATTAFGALVGLLVRRRYRSRIQGEVAELEAIRRLGLDEPQKTLPLLAAFRRRTEKALLAGTLTEDQFQILQGRTGALSARHLQNLLDQMQGRPSPGFVTKLESALLDGVVDEHELATLRAALRAESGLGPAERRRIAEVLRAWPSS